MPQHERPHVYVNIHVTLHYVLWIAYEAALIGDGMEPMVSKFAMRYGLQFRGVQLLPYRFQLRRNSHTTNDICQLCDINVPLVLTSIADA